MKAIRTILYATDFSRTSNRAFAAAVRAAKANQARLLVVHVLAPVAPIIGDDYVSSPEAYVEIERNVRATAQRHLRRLVARARQAGVRAGGLLLEGTPDRQIVRAAKSKRADLVVMGTHGRTGLARLFLGSVAERVIGNAPCPVLAVRTA